MMIEMGGTRTCRRCKKKGKDCKCPCLVCGEEAPMISEEGFALCVNHNNAVNAEQIRQDTEQRELERFKMLYPVVAFRAGIK
jgi:hypothetical protein